MNRAERRRAEKEERKRLKAKSPLTPDQIVEKHWRDRWTFDGRGLTVRRALGRSHYFPGV